MNAPVEIWCKAEEVELLSFQFARITMLWNYSSLLLSCLQPKSLALDCIVYYFCLFVLFRKWTLDRVDTVPTPVVHSQHISRPTTYRRTPWCRYALISSLYNGSSKPHQHTQRVNTVLIAGCAVYFNIFPFSCPPSVDMLDNLLTSFLRRRWWGCRWGCGFRHVFHPQRGHHHLIRHAQMRV